MADADTFASKYKNCVASLDAEPLGVAIQEYERQQERLGRIMSYAHLVYAGNITDSESGRFFQTMQEKVNEIATILLFFELELRRIEEDDLDAKQSAHPNYSQSFDPGCGTCGPFGRISYRTR